jgi:hypothetical protein
LLLSRKTTHASSTPLRVDGKKPLEKTASLNDVLFLSELALADAPLSRPGRVCVGGSDDGDAPGCH